MIFFAAVKKLILALAYIAGISILLMIAITVLDVMARLFHTGITGAYDLLRALGVVAVACSLPYLTAVKGHIAIEFLYHRCSKRGRFILDGIFRLSSIILFSIICHQTFLYGFVLYSSGEVFPNLGLPVFWIPFVISFNTLLMLIVFLFHLLHPGKEYIKP